MGRLIKEHKSKERKQRLRKVVDVGANETWYEAENALLQTKARKAPSSKAIASKYKVFFLSP
jgi:hypothetical protein